MNKPLRCQSLIECRLCGKPAVTMFKNGSLRVPLCADCKAEIDAIIAERIGKWAERLAGGASVHDLEV